MKNYLSRYINIFCFFKKRVISVFLFLFVVTSGAFANYEDNVESAGDWIQMGIPIIALGATFFEKGDEQWYGSLQMAESFTATFLATHALKRAINRQRPSGGGHSFPSGHTSAAFQGASFIHFSYGIKFAIPAYLGAAFVGYSRVEADKHYVTDVLAGAALGVLGSYFFTTPYKNTTIQPVVGVDYYGINVGRSF